MPVRQRGQLAWEDSQTSIQGTWKECRHAGSARTSSPSLNSHKHTEHVLSSPITTPAASLYVHAARIIMGGAICASWLASSGRAPVAGTSDGCSRQPRMIERKRVTTTTTKSRINMELVSSAMEGRFHMSPPFAMNVSWALSSTLLSLDYMVTLFTSLMFDVFDACLTQMFM